MTNSDRIELLEKFSEGTELEDAVQLLLDAASILTGISCDNDSFLVLSIVESLIRNYYEYARDGNLSWEDYNEINPELYTYILGGARKLTQEGYVAR